MNDNDAAIDSKTLRATARAALRAAKAAAAKAGDDLAGWEATTAVWAAEAEVERVEAVILARGKASRRAYATWAGNNGYGRDFA